MNPFWKLYISNYISEQPVEMKYTEEIVYKKLEIFWDQITYVLEFSEEFLFEENSILLVIAESIADVLNHFIPTILTSFVDT